MIIKVTYLLAIILTTSQNLAQTPDIVFNDVIYDVDTIDNLDDRIYARITTRHKNDIVDIMYGYVLPDTLTSNSLGAKRTFPYFLPYFTKQVTYKTTYLKVIPHGELIVFGKNEIVRVIEYDEGEIRKQEYKALNEHADPVDKWKPPYRRDPYVPACGEVMHIIALSRELVK